MKPDSKKVTEFRVAHDGINLFVIEEALAIPPAYFALIDEMMTAAFNPKHKKNVQGDLPPFGGKKMLFLGDQAQLPPIGGPAVYDDGRTACDSLKTKRETKQSNRTKTGPLIFETYLVPNCIYLQRTQKFRSSRRLLTTLATNPTELFDNTTNHYFEHIITQNSIFLMEHIKSPITVNTVSSNSCRF